MELNGNYLIIDLDVCFECGKPMEEMHHIIPKSRGGKKTIPLCIDCHGKAHNIEHRRLILNAAREGLKKYIENGGKVGRKKGYKKTKDKILDDHKDVVKYLKKGLSVRKVMEKTNKSSGTVQKVKKLIQIL